MFKEGWKVTGRKGDVGESFILWYCNTYNLTYKKANEDENRLKGIDCFIEGVATDVKNSSKIFLGRYDFKYEKFMTRHPFNSDTEAVNICILDINEKESIFKIVYNDSIQKYFVENYFKDVLSFEEAQSILHSFQFKRLSDFGYSSVDTMLLELKKKLVPLLRPNVSCHYDDSSYTRERTITIKKGA